MPYRYRDTFVVRLSEDIASLVVTGVGDVASIEERLDELGAANLPALTAYHRSMRSGLGVPDTVFKEASPYYFRDEPPARTFRTSGTTGSVRGQAAYSPRGMELMDLSILTNARRHVIGGLIRPVILRLVPAERDAPEMVMAHGMECISATYGHPELSTCVIDRRGVDYGLLEARIAGAHSEGAPVVLIGATFAFVNIAEALIAAGKVLALPTGSRIVDAGGFKGRARAVTVDALRALLARAFAVPTEQCINLFGMTELASQLYDAADRALGPHGERPKGRLSFVRPEVRDAHSLTVRGEGPGLLEVVDLCIIDRPHRVLTGDRGIACEAGVAVAGRVARGQARGCSLSLDALTERRAAC